MTKIFATKINFAHRRGLLSYLGLKIGSRNEKVENHWPKQKLTCLKFAQSPDNDRQRNKQAMAMRYNNLFKYMM